MSRNPCIGSDLVADVVADRVRAQPLTRPTNVVFGLKNDYDMHITYRVAWLGVEKAGSEVYDDHVMSFDQLRWYSDAVMENNPNGYINLDFQQQTGRFVWYFISFRTYINGFKHCRPLLFLDDTFLKGRFKGNLLAATAMDGNQGLFPVAFAIVDSENAANWEWFLRQLSEVVDHGRNLTFVSDRHIGLLQSMSKFFLLAHHAFCLIHLQMNLRDRMKYVNAKQKLGLMRKLRECAYVPTVTSFNLKIEVLKLCSPVVVGEFLKDLDPKHWANTHFGGRRYGEMSSNAAESFNNWIREARHLPIMQLVDAIRGQTMEQMLKRQVKGNKWVGQLCPKIEKKLEAEYKTSKPWIVKRFPCSHAVVSFQNSGRNIYDSIEPYYHVSEFKASYSESIHSIPTVEKPIATPIDYLIAPPVVKRSSGRPKRKRIPSRGEVVQRIRCGRCGKMGNHNMKTFKEPI
ncbi:uncharacterized protein LOC114320342 [Camellia sinensis]|uniref:uncharacterized protein LOC114320342 n=1 Tax=Camellia sinensis TaxID=4442 RepID=UPI00103648F5|nr:uncharacterized protein LOC114320342 [Camellia sinensis]